jgi:pimeloyl-ACP methyl ester carboxylesterase
MLRRLLRVLALFCAGASLSSHHVQAQGTALHLEPVKVVAPDRLDVPTATGIARLAIFVSAAWAMPRPEVTRAVLVIHGILRNADVYYANALKARAAGGPEAASSLMVVPQFLSDDDAKAHGLGFDTLVWQRDGWSAGMDAVAPSPISSFAALDAIMAKLADGALFPNLSSVVVAGHSGGGQVVQRYAAVGKGESALAARGIRVRYVVANPSSYLYFTDERPGPDGRLAPFAGAAACPNYNHWKYGFAGGVPDYVDQTVEAYEARYAGRDVVYLLGTDDLNPNHPRLDKSCMGEAQGPYRYARGHWFVAQMQARLAASFTHRLYDVPGVGHEAGKMFGSACGLAALFDTAGCPPK